MIKRKCTIGSPFLWGLSWGKVRYFILKFFLEMFSKVFPWEFEVGMQMTTWLININRLKDYWAALDVNNI